MTITLDAQPGTLALLDAAGIRYTVNDPARALDEERERGQKYREGSPKRAAHLERLKRLEAECAAINGMAPRKTHGVAPGSASVRRVADAAVPRRDDGGAGAVESAAPLSQLQLDAVLALIVLQGCKRDAAEKAVLRASGDDAQSLALNARRFLEA